MMETLKDTIQWWHLIALHFVYQLYLIGLSVVYLVLDGQTTIPGAFFSGSFYVYYLLLPVTAIALVYDRRTCNEKSGWTPSVFYFGMVVPVLLGIVLSPVYLYRRHQMLGTP